MNLLLGRRWLLWTIKRGMQTNIWLKEKIDLPMAYESSERVKWEISELDAKLKSGTLSEKKEIERCIQAKQSREQVLDSGQANIGIMEAQVISLKKKLEFIKNLK